jgi:hypothetical protein
MQKQNKKTERETMTDKQYYLEELNITNSQLIKTELLLDKAETELEEIIYSLQEKLEEMRYNRKKTLGE